MITRDSNGEIRFHYVDDQDEVVSALREIFTGNEVGKNYKQNFYTKASGDADYEKLIKAAVRIAGGPMISAGNLTHALELLIDSGELQPKNVSQSTQLEEPEGDIRPLDKNGKLLTEQQIAWGEMARFAGTATPDAIRQRRHTDRAFADFVRTNLRREMQEQPVGDAVTPEGQPTTKARASKELESFAHKFLVEPSSNLRPKNGMVSLAGELIPWPTFNDLLSKATAARLL